MEIAAVALAALALLVALIALSRASGQRQRIDDNAIEAKRRAENVKEETERNVQNLRQMLVAVAEGAAPTREMILEGRLWRDIEGPDARKLVASGEVRIVDVRTPQETANGILPGALLIPIDTLESRIKELPRDGKPMLVYCAGGGRSAAACEFLSSEGYSRLHNLAGGIGAWNGPVQKP